MRKKIKVSVIVPVYNTEMYLHKCLDSLVNQTLKEIEIIVVNDGTKDNSQAIIDEFSKKYPDKVFSYIKPNGGLSSARNYGVAKAHGEFLGFVDSDDYVNLDMYELMYDKATKTSSDIVVCGMKSIYENEDYMNFVQTDNKFGYSLSESPDLMLYSRSYACNKIYSRKMWNEHKCEFPNQWFEDSALIYNVLYYAKKIEVVKKPLYNYLRTNENSIVNTINPKIFDIFKSCDSLLNFYRDKGEALYQNACNLCLSHIAARFSYFKNSKDYEIMRQYSKTAKEYLNKNIPDWHRRKYLKALHYYPKFIKKGVKYINNYYRYRFSQLFKPISRFNRRIGRCFMRLVRKVERVLNKDVDISILKDVFEVFNSMNLFSFCQFNTLVRAIKKGKLVSRNISIGLVIDQKDILELKYRLLELGLDLTKDYYYNDKIYEQRYTFDKLNLTLNFYERKDDQFLTYIFYRIRGKKYQPYKMNVVEFKQTAIKKRDFITIDGIELPIPHNSDVICEKDYGEKFVNNNKMDCLSLNGAEPLKKKTYYRKVRSSNNEREFSEEEKYEYLHKLQQIELQILQEIMRICEKNKITYYLGEGSLLGAVRHKGFIPWDDDIDVLMPRDEYERFLKLAPEQISSQYEVQHSTLIPNYWSPFIKIRYLDNSFFAQQHIAHLTDHNGPLIDIFPVDNVPKKNSLGQMLQALTIKFSRGMLSYKLRTRHPKKLKGYIVCFCSHFFSVKTIHKILSKTFIKYNDENNEYFVNLASYYWYDKQTVPKEWYGKPRMVKFENLKVPIPRESEKLLTSIYGDYLQLPPVENRVIKHHF